MKIYVVVADNHWIEDVFSSGESAEKYIKERDEYARFVSERIYELEEISNDRPLTDEEDKELGELYFSNEYCIPHNMWIEERTLKD